MGLFVNFYSDQLVKLKKKCLSPEISVIIKKKYNLDINYDILLKSIDFFVKNKDIWYDDVEQISKIKNQKCDGSFFALKHAFIELNMVTLDYPSKDLDEEHIVNAFERGGYSPWR